MTFVKNLIDHPSPALKECREMAFQKAFRCGFKVGCEECFGSPTVGAVGSNDFRDEIWWDDVCEGESDDSSPIVRDEGDVLCWVSCLEVKDETDQKRVESIGTVSFRQRRRATVRRKRKSNLSVMAQSGI